MAAEYALQYLGLVTELTDEPPWLVRDNPDDYTSDSTSSRQFYNFSEPYFLDDKDFVPWSLPEKAKIPDSDVQTVTADTKVTLESIDDTPAEDYEVSERLFEDEEFCSRFLGKFPQTIIGQLNVGPQYSLVAETGDQLCPMFAMSLTVKGEMFYGAGSNKKLAKARAARSALHKLYNIEFGVAESMLILNNFVVINEYFSSYGVCSYHFAK